MPRRNNARSVPKGRASLKPESRKSSHASKGKGRNSPAKGGQQLRIIGGQWRSRRLKFADVQGLRPTMDKVRETLFNWLQWDIEGKRVLDCFAGSGALSYEALSRGAKGVTLLELNAKACQCILASLNELEASNAKLHQVDAIAWLGQNDVAEFELVFLDPPFNQGLLAPAIERLVPQLADGCLVYVEVESGADLSCIPASWQALKRKDTQEFSFILYQLG